jgi:hypothetical protein
MVAIDIVRGNRQKMWIMNVVWILTPLYSGPIGLWAYLSWGTRDGQKPFWQSVATAAMHCGSGCTLGDIIAESAFVFVPFALFGRELFGAWALDYVCAFLIGIGFQYFTIAPMRGLSLGEGLLAALKADTLSLTSWQVGMYGWMAIAVFLIFGRELDKSSAVFWFMMQIAMLAGFATSFPINWWLLRTGVKEIM